MEIASNLPPLDVSIFLSSHTKDFNIEGSVVPMRQILLFLFNLLYCYANVLDSHLNKTSYKKLLIGKYLANL